MRPLGFLRRLLGDRRGATAIEYGLILALVFLAIIAAIMAVGGETGGLWAHVGEKVVSAGDGL